MKVEIWSDVMCPFCYIGKRRFESALNKLQDKQKVEVEWKSFQLNPDMITDADKNMHQHLADIKGWSLEHAMKMNDHVSEMAREVGLVYNLDNAVVANSFDAHRLSHLAKKYNKQDALEEELFKAYFTDGRNTADPTTLIDIGVAAGLNASEIKAMLQGNEFSGDVVRDAYEAEKLGVRGVPFFVFDRKYAISGAQPEQLFIQTLEQAVTEWEKEKVLSVQPGKEDATCTVDGNC